MSTPTVDRIAYRPAEAALALGLSRSRVYELMAEGVIAYRQIGNTRLKAPARAPAVFGKRLSSTTYRPLP